MAREIVIRKAKWNNYSDVTLSFTGEPLNPGLPEDKEVREAFYHAAAMDAEVIFAVLRSRIPSATYDKLAAMFQDPPNVE